MIRLHNARIMPMLSPGDCSIVEGELWTDGGRISYVGTPREDMPAFEREIDLGGDLIIPGFNGRAHAQPHGLSALLCRRPAAA